jgi:hypothetical protein
MFKLLRRVLPMLLLFAPTAVASAQSLPTSQPAFLRIIREDVKVGRGAEHTKLEAGWPAAFERAKSPDYYLGMESMTSNEAWFIIPAASYAAMGESMAREQEPALAAELARLARADGELINSWRAIEARARPELSYGKYPDLSQQRFWEITLFRMRPGSGDAFSAMAKAYGAAAGRAAGGVAYRVYEVLAGMPGPSYLVFSSVGSFGEFDKMIAADDAIGKAMTPDDQAIAKKYFEGLINSETFRFRLSPEMSYVPKETRAADPAFWMPKKPATRPAATAKPATTAAPKPSGE